MSGVSPARHLLAFLRRYLSDDNIDVASFMAISDWQDTLGIVMTCDVTFSDNKTPVSFLENLTLGICDLVIKNNKISIEQKRASTGERGILIPNENIIEYSKIYKEKNNKIYSYAIITYDGGIERQYLGDSNLSVSYSKDGYITDATKSWSDNELYGKFIYLIPDSSGYDEKIAKITSNTATKIFFDDVNNEWTADGTCDYAILETNNCYTANYSTGDFVVTAGADSIASTILATQISEKLIVELIVVDEKDIFSCGDIVSLNNPDEGLTYQVFRIEQLERNTEDKIVRLTLIDELLYPEITNTTSVLTAPVLTGSRNTPSSAQVSWTTISGALSYRIYYGTDINNLKNNKFITVTSTSYTLINLIESLKVYVAVSAINSIGVESELSNIVELAVVPFEALYIDGSNGYIKEKYTDWGNLEDYYFGLTYKEVNSLDVKYLQKTPLVILDSTQYSSSAEISQAAFSGDLASNTLGYIDCAGVTDSGVTSLSVVKTAGSTKSMQVPSGFDKSLRLGATVFAAGDEITDSDDWFLKHDSEYYNYWSIANFMCDISNADYRDWFCTWKIDKTLGCFESNVYQVTNAGTISTNLFTAVSQAKFASWETDQWKDYYVYFPEITNEKKWYKITANGASTLSIQYSGDTEIVTRYIINNTDNIGFDGCFIDDVWTELYDMIDGVITDMTGDSNTTCDWTGSDYLTDFSKEWSVDQWVGYWIQIAGAGSWFSIVGTSKYNPADTYATVINFNGPNLNTGHKAYEIISPLEYVSGKTYAENMVIFLAGDGASWDGIVKYLEDVSKRKTGSADIVDDGNIVLNTYPQDWTAYQSFVDAVTVGDSQHFVMDEALQSSWNDAAPSANKNFRVLDWGHALYRHGQLKITNSGGNKYPRVLTLGYPYCQKSLNWHLCGANLLSRYSAIIEDMVSGGDVNLKELYYDTMQAKAHWGQNNNQKTLGYPVNAYVQNTDRYGVSYREFDGAWIFYNPSRKMLVYSFNFTEDVIDNHAGSAKIGTSNVYMLPRSANIYYKLASEAGINAAEFYQDALLFNYTDCNAAWVIITAAGAAKIGTNSVWINNGHSAHKTLIDNNNYTLPQGNPSLLLKGGHASYPATVGYDPSTESIVGLFEDSVTLTDLTIYGVVKLRDTDSSVDLVMGTDYQIEFTEETTDSKWNTKIYFITDQTSVNIDVYYYAQGTMIDGTPNYEYTNKELGIIYRNSGFALYTGAIDYADCLDSGGTELIEDEDYYLIPEPIRWEWLYRQKITALNNSNLAISTKKIKNPNNNENGYQAIQWGNVDPDNLILIDANSSSEGCVNGKPITYDTRTVKKPKILIFGFYNDPRKGDYSTTYAPIDRGSQDSFRLETKFKNLEGTSYDEVIITGEYDGIFNVENGGAYGSIQGWLNYKGYTDLEDAWNYLTDNNTKPITIIINDNFSEGDSTSPTSRTQYSSWLDAIDYEFIRHGHGHIYKAVTNYSQNILLIDRRFGLTAFVWYGGKVVIQNSLINKGSDLLDDGTIWQTNLVHIAGVSSYAGISYSTLSDNDVELYTKEIEAETYYKFATDFSLDQRIFNNKVVGVTDHYSVGDNLNNSDDNPIYNIFEQGGTFLGYIPRASETGSDNNGGARKNKILTSKLYLKYIDPIDVNEGIKYYQLGLANIIENKIPSMIMRDSDESYFVAFSGSGYERFGDENNDYAEWIIDKGNAGDYFCIAFMLHRVSSDSSVPFLGKYIYIDELSEESENPLIINSSLWQGYTGHYLSDSGHYTGATDSKKYISKLNGKELEKQYPYDYKSTLEVSAGSPGVITYTDRSLSTNPFGFDYFYKFNSFNDPSQQFYDMDYIDGFIRRPIFFSNIREITKIGDTDEIRIRFDFYSDTLVDRSEHAYFYCGISNITDLTPSTNTDNFCLFDIEITRFEKNYNSVVITSSRLSEDLLINSFPSTNDSYGKIWFYYKEHLDTTYYDNDEILTYDTPTNNDLGGLYTNVNIATTFMPIGKYDAALDGRYHVTKDRDDYDAIGLIPFEVYYQDRIDEFGFEFNTGLLTAMAFWKNGNDYPPTLIWSGMSEGDIKIVIDNFVGTDITYTNLQTNSDGTYYIYYNSLTEMLNIYADDLFDRLPWPYKYQDIDVDDFINNGAINYFTLDESIMDGGDVFK